MSSVNMLYVDTIFLDVPLFHESSFLAQNTHSLSNILHIRLYAKYNNNRVFFSL